MSTATRRVMAMAAALAGAAAVITLGFLRHLPAAAPRTHVAWWVLAVAFAASEVFVIHLDVRRDTYSISLMELPFVIGLFLASPVALVGGRILGAGAALVLHRRQAVLKLVFNVSLFAAETAVGVLVFRLVAGGVSSVDPASWGAAFLAALTANVVSAASVASVIRLNGGRAASVRGLITGALIPPIANTSLALGAAALLWNQPQAAWLLAAIATVLVLGYRAYATQSQRYADLQGLYDFTHSIQQVARSEDVVASLLASMQQLLRAEVAEISLVLDEGGEVVVHRGEPGNGVAISRVARHDMGELWADAVATGTSVLARHGTRDGRVRAALAAAGRRDCIIVPMVADDRVVGTAVVADREGDVSTFDDNDVRFFQAVVDHISVALENAQLVGRLEHDALHDALTGLPNRSHFNLEVEAAIRQRRRGTKIAVILMDLDRFKEVNDTLGHHHGDRLLCEVGIRLSQALPVHVTAARLGGDEFGLVCRDVADEQDALLTARVIRDLLAEPFLLDDMLVDVGATLGIALSPDHGEDAATLMQRADVAMYSAKGAAGIEVYTADRDQYSPRRLTLIGELRQALEAGSLDVYYQPKAELATGVAVGVEALVRWNHPLHGFIPPTEFVPIAEHTGLIRPLTLYVLRRAVAQARAWSDDGVDLHVAVNVSVRNLVDLDLVADLRAILVEHGVRPGQLTLEITESSIMDDPTRTIAILTELASMGVRLSVDDFGTGYSSLAYLKRLPVHEVKIDKSFVATMATDPSDRAIVRSIVDLARNLGLAVVAEGVETRTAWNDLVELGCSIAQGYYLSPPVPAPELRSWLRTWTPGGSEGVVTSLASRRSAALR